MWRYPLAHESVNKLYLDVAARKIRYFGVSVTQGMVVRSLDLGRAADEQWQRPSARYAIFSGDGTTMGLAWRESRTEHFELRNAATGRRITVNLPDIALRPYVGAEGLDELMSLSQDGRIIAYGVYRALGGPYPNAIYVWDVDRHQMINKFPADKFQGMLLSPDGRNLMTTQLARNEITVHAVRPPSSKHSLHYDMLGAALGSNGEWSIGGNLRAIRPDGRVLLTNKAALSLPSGKEIQNGPQSSTVYAFSPDGKYLAADEGGLVTLWDGSLRRRLGVLASSVSNASGKVQEEVTALAFSHDGRTLAVAGSQGTIQLWDVPSRVALGSSLPTAGDVILSVAFSPDDTAVYAAGQHLLWHKYVIDPTHVVTAVCARVGVSLSRADWEAYLPEVPYQKTCPERRH